MTTLVLVYRMKGDKIRVRRFTYRLRSFNGAQWCAVTNLAAVRADGLHRFHHVIAFRHCTKDHVAAIQPRAQHSRDEELWYNERFEMRSYVSHERNTINNTAQKYRNITPSTQVLYKKDVSVSPESRSFRGQRSPEYFVTRKSSKRVSIYAGQDRYTYHGEKTHFIVL